MYKFDLRALYMNFCFILTSGEYMALLGVHTLYAGHNTILQIAEKARKFSLNYLFIIINILIIFPR